MSRLALQNAQLQASLRSQLVAVREARSRLRPLKRQAEAAERQARGLLAQGAHQAELVEGRGPQLRDQAAQVHDAIASRSVVDRRSRSSIAPYSTTRAARVHGRTVEQKYIGPSRWSFLREVKDHVGERTILGSGDLFTAEDVVRLRGSVQVEHTLAREVGLADYRIASGEDAERSAVDDGLVWDERGI